MTDNFFKNKTARSVFYIIFVSGLLSLTSFSLMIIWDYFTINNPRIHQISFLEAVGICAFVYVIYFGVKFGEHRQNVADYEEYRSNGQPPVKKSQPINPEIINKIPESQKQEMLHFISRCCGMENNISTLHSSFRTSHQAEKKENII